MKHINEFAAFVKQGKHLVDCTVTGYTTRTLASAGGHGLRLALRPSIDAVSSGGHSILLSSGKGWLRGLASVTRLHGVWCCEAMLFGSPVLITDSWQLAPLHTDYLAELYPHGSTPKVPSEATLPPPGYPTERCSSYF